MYWFVYVIALILATLAFFLWLGVIDFTKVKFTTLEASQFLYFDVQCEYPKIGSSFERLKEDIENEFSKEEIIYGGVYFDNPGRIQKKHLSRAAVGAFLLTHSGLEKARSICERSPRYKMISLPEVSTPSSYFLDTSLSHFPKLSGIIVVACHRVVLSEDCLCC